MSLNDLIRLVRARLAALNSAQATAAAIGDVEQTVRIAAEVSQTQTTLDQLLTLAV